ncbi:MAG: DUF3617 family protein [Thermodesulfovibrio sp.]|jgi:hypothetical protein|uniref:DUF3617 domain-containing protein n=1 Tax=unclassified Thermodesulfovibrio TaxID=2645936 RepID=UPI000855F722|nr:MULTISPECIES: DUF3617 family protein [unclassified Thermodesulfovibrio]MDI1472048.1 DUF3617 family protein [Thermodesulfovibrio sp. 1176]MDI6715157.1 DUF3617 family protein [Thermodesulfovibrio sp.]ODA45194.1 hypothetical protein THER_0069 [Thermodesulfovibrio sp. N1]
MYRKFLLLLIVVSLFFFACGSKPSGPNMKEGKWEITVKIETTGNMPFQMPPQTFTQCITKDKAIPQKAETDQDCKITKSTMSGDTVNWTIECKTPEGPVISEGTVTYKGDRFDGVVKMKHFGMDITQYMNGKWIGDCK